MLRAALAAAALAATLGHPVVEVPDEGGPFETPRASAPQEPPRNHSADARPAKPTEARCAVGVADVRMDDTTTEAPVGTDIDHAQGWSSGPRTGRNGCYWIHLDGYFTAARAQVVQVLVDTRWGPHGTAGPELYAFGYSDRDANQRNGAFLLRRAHGGGYSFARCPVATDFAPRGTVRLGDVSIGIPKACLGSPRRIRVTAQVWDVRRFLPHHLFDTSRSIGDATPPKPGHPRKSTWSAPF